MTWNAKQSGDATCQFTFDAVLLGHRIGRNVRRRANLQKRHEGAGLVGKDEFSAAGRTLSLRGCTADVLHRWQTVPYCWRVECEHSSSVSRRCIHPWYSRLTTPGRPRPPTPGRPLSGRHRPVVRHARISSASCQSCRSTRARASTSSAPSITRCDEPTTTCSAPVRRAPVGWLTARTTTRPTPSSRWGRWRASTPTARWHSSVQRTRAKPKRDWPLPGTFPWSLSWVSRRYYYMYYHYFYTVNHKKRDILFLTITLANLNPFL